MVAVPSTMQALGSPASGFNLPSANQQNTVVDLLDFSGKPLLVMFICNHCPFVIHIAEVMARVGNQAQGDGFGVVAISANDVGAYPQDGPDKMAEFATQYGMAFPYLFDASQAVAKSYGAACTPDFFVYDHNHRLQYRGQMDSSRPSNDSPVDGADLLAALEEVAQGRAPDENQTPSIGCNIKWRPGNEPDYF
ncbi:MAG: thioredoxin family protein [Acidiferrobacterales bacterium]|nr:thioredoxin family protein [Acidiferrobacterales bacterium]